jgi:hypothetical protein
MTRRKIEDFKTSKYQNKKLSKFTRRKANTTLSPPPLRNFTQLFFLKTHKMSTRKIEDSKWNFKIVK